MKDKYIKYSNLLLGKCLNISSGQPLLISAPIESIDFIKILSECALKRGVTDIYYDWYDDELKHQQLSYLAISDLDKSLFWNKGIYDTYAKKNAAFLMFCSESPDIMSDIDSDKLAYTSDIYRTSRPIYKKMQSTNDIAWCIASVSTYGWASKVFDGCDNCVLKLWNTIFDICLINSDDPIASWDDKLILSNNRSSLLNKYKFKTLHYTNSLGTDLYIGLDLETIWQGAGDIMPDGRSIICNMPTEEIFTTPNRFMTNGVVYSSKPLVYNGSIIDNFWISFKDGKVTRFDASKGKDILSGIINGDNNSCYLGECALVPYDSPISNSGILFYNTLFDENASCHLALGNGFPNCLGGTSGKSREQLLDMGMNVSDVHVDFMIGTEDLMIEGITYNGDNILIFDNGNFVLDC